MAGRLCPPEFTGSKFMNRLISSAFLTLALTGCGADLVGTAATEAQLSAQQAKQAQQMKDQVRSQLNAAMQTEQDRMRQAEEAANQ
jgi:ElaB/YqjD/DUF883 family membrane-anchored ribosome-binding protein